MMCSIIPEPSNFLSKKIEVTRVRFSTEQMFTTMVYHLPSARLLYKDDCFFFSRFCTEVQGWYANGTLSPMRGRIPFSAPAHAQRLTKDSHNTGNFMPCSFRIVCGFFNVLQWTYINMEGNCETGPTVYRPYPRRLERLTICWFNYKLSTQLF